MVSPRSTEDGESSTTTAHDNFTRGLDSQAMPALAAYERNPSLLDIRRESLNLPPSPELAGPQYSALNLQVIQYAGALNEVFAVEGNIYQQHEALLRRKVKIEDVMEYERRTLSGADPYKECASVGRPVGRLGTEANIELERIELFRKTNDQCSDTTKKELAEMDILDRYAMARHFVRQRWEMMRVWNEKWKLTTSPKANWTWPWQKDRPGEDVEGNLALVRDAVDKCGAMSPGEYGAEMKKKACNQKPRKGWSSAQGDDFIGSRPWFAFDVECMVEWTRRDGVQLNDQQCWPTTPGDFVRRQWMERGIWNDKWDYMEGVRKEPIVGWRWKGEDNGKGKRKGKAKDNDEGDEPRWADLEELSWMKDTLHTLKKADRVVKDGDAVPKRSRRIVERKAAERRAAEAAQAAARETTVVPPSPPRPQPEPEPEPEPEPQPAGRGRGQRREASQSLPPTRKQPEREWKGKRRPYIKEEDDKAADQKSAAGAPARKRRRRG